VGDSSAELIGTDQGVLETFSAVALSERLFRSMLVEHRTPRRVIADRHGGARTVRTIVPTDYP
jgi:hypothetical protein